MRYNKQELAALASQASQNFDREGVLVLKERQEGFFRRSEGCSARWFRLRGNMLFYLRGTEQLSEPLGVIVLGNHLINVLPQDENGHWPFHIVWNNGTCYKMATFLESERTLWLKAIDSAPYETLRTQMSVLKEKLNRVRPEIDVAAWRLKRGIVVDINVVPVCELALSCDNLPCDATGRPPSAAVALYVLSDGAAVRYAATEIVYSSSNPTFSTTIQVRACDALAPTTRLRLVVCDVRDAAAGCAVVVGSQCTTLASVQEAQRLRVSLIQAGPTASKSAGKSAGFLTISGWSLEPSAAVADSHCVEVTQKMACHRRSHSLPPRLGVRLKMPPTAAALRAALGAGWQATFRFHSGLGADIAVQDRLWEPRVCYTMPAQLLSIYILSERRALSALASLDECGGAWRARHWQLLRSHVALVRRYCARHARCRAAAAAGECFKESPRKDEPALEFVPVNLHLHRMWAHNDSLGTSGAHDVVTAGAFAAHAQRTDGLIRLVQQVKGMSNTKLVFNQAAASKLQAESDNIAAIQRLRDEIAQSIDDIIESPLPEHESTTLFDDITNKVTTIAGLWDPAAVEEAEDFVRWIQKDGECNGNGKEQTPIQRIKEQLSRLDLISSDMEPIDPPPLPPSLGAGEAAAPPPSDDALYFDNDYFTPEFEGAERCSSLRVKKSEERFDCRARLRGEFRSSTSLDQVPCARETTQQEAARRPRPTAAAPRVVDRGAALDEALGAFARELAAAAAPASADSERASRLRAPAAGVLGAADALLARLRAAHAAARLRCEEPAWTRAHAHLQIRRDACFSQALTTVTTGLHCWLCSAPTETVAKLLAAELGPLCAFEGLLSLYGTETAMWGDMVVAIEDLQGVVFRLASRAECPNSLPQVRGSRGAITVLIPVTDVLLSRIPNKKHRSFTVTAVHFNVGVNEKAALAEALRDTAAQAQANEDNGARLSTYCHRYRKLFAEELAVAARASSRTLTLDEAMATLQRALHRRAARDTEVLRLAALAARLVNGIRFTCCKSGKDRTGMSVTLEQCRVLTAQYQLADADSDHALRVLRSEGCRREIVRKNIGVRKYAFTKRQVAALPEQYRPPAGTYGAAQT